ncbi:MAG: peptidylprolyl isomerase [Janthinobacterium lividum]
MTRHPSRWSAAIALMIAAAPAVLAQVPMSPGMPPMPPVAPPPTITPTTPAPAGVAAIVNGKKIYRFQVANQALTQSGPQILNTMILIELINEEAIKQNIVITPAQVDAQLVIIRQRAAAQIPGGLDTILSQRHQTLAALKEQILPQMKAEALVEKSLPPTIMYHARHLLIMVTAAPSPMGAGAKPTHTDAEALALIAKAQAELKAGKSFTDVANEYTEDPSGKGKGGDLGVIDASTSFDPAFLKAALALKPGQVTQVPVKSQYGYHLIQIDSSSLAPLPTDQKLYDAALPAARRQQVQAAIPHYVEGLRAKAKVIDYLGH